MSRPKPVICDGCGTDKKSTNKWYLAVVSNEQFTVLPFYDGTPPSPSGDLLDFCGRGCLLKRLSEWMEERERAG